MRGLGEQLEDARGEGRAAEARAAQNAHEVCQCPPSPLALSQQLSLDKLPSQFASRPRCINSIQKTHLFPRSKF
jgi:hypothetical protein